MKKQSYNRSNILSIAHYLRSKLSIDFSLAQKLSWLRTRVKSALKTGITKFYYKKANGSIREALGTLNGTYFSYESKGSTTQENHLQVRYWDIDVQSFRSFRIERLISFEAA